MAEEPETILEPDLPIVDPHHHVWYVTDATLAGLAAVEDPASAALVRSYARHQRYLFDELLADVTAGHNVRATVFVEAHTLYRRDGPAELRSAGEIEVARGIAAMADSGTFGDVRLCAGLVGGVDLRFGDAVPKIVEEHLRAGGSRFRGVRAQQVCHDPNLTGLKHVLGPAHVLEEPEFIKGAAHLEAFGLSLDTYALENQLAEVAGLARKVPGVQIVLNHTGGIVGTGPYAGPGIAAERFAAWRVAMSELAQFPNIALKVGGLGMALCGFAHSALVDRAGSAELAEDWRPHVESSIEIFGADRCMFESNYPVDSVTATYPVLWNAFKRITAACSHDEKTALFSGTASRIYRL